MFQMTRWRLAKLLDPRRPLRRLSSLVRRHSALQTRKTALLSPALVCQAARQTHTSRRVAGKELLTFSRPLSLCCSSFNSCRCADVEMVFLWATGDLRWHLRSVCLGWLHRDTPLLCNSTRPDAVPQYFCLLSGQTWNFKHGLSVQSREKLRWGPLILLLRLHMNMRHISSHLSLGANVR